ncbi:hypothetical protein P7K49_002417 [Saguinus oedipus]|uniref:Serine hydrolase-like protein n=1 Tax=Saguinus oedipus TaxID=9490 RepID=A0ABQ9WHC0_SAGOE|nr:hypothetical protein P7K49_002417 [Saguinus oedipus]
MGPSDRNKELREHQLHGRTIEGMKVWLCLSGLISELRLAVPWGHIAAKAWGSLKGSPVLCLHGWLDNANSFDRLIPLLPQGEAGSQEGEGGGLQGNEEDHETAGVDTCSYPPASFSVSDLYYVAMDFGGHGLSSHYSPGVPYYHQNFVNEIRRVVAALKWNQFSIMGHSFGGIVAGMEVGVKWGLLVELMLPAPYPVPEHPGVQPGSGAQCWVQTWGFSCTFPEMVDKLILLDSSPFVLDFHTPRSGQEKGCGGPLGNCVAWELRNARLVMQWQGWVDGSCPPTPASSGSGPLAVLTEPHVEVENLLTYKRRAIEHTLQVEASQKPLHVVSPEEMLQGFLKNNSHVSEKCGELLLRRGTKKVAADVTKEMHRPWKRPMVAAAPEGESRKQLFQGEGTTGGRSCRQMENVLSWVKRPGFLKLPAA